MKYLTGISETLGADVTIYDPSNSETGFAFSEKRPQPVTEKTDVENDTSSEEIPALSSQFLIRFIWINKVAGFMIGKR